MGEISITRGMPPEDPAVFLKSPPSERAETLTRQLDKHHGAEVEWWRFAELAVRHRDHAEWISDHTAWEQKIKNRANRAMGLFVASILTVIGGIAHRLIDEGRNEERASQLERSRIEDREVQRRETDELRRQIGELRADLRRLSGASDHPMDGTDDLTEPEGKFASSVGALSAIESLLTGGTPPVPRPRPESTCGAICSSSVECGGLIQTCRFCNFGTCKSTRPEQPPPDAGIDAAPGGTQP